jgi:hypothetical protein
MHPEDHPAVGGIARLSRTCGTRRVLSLVAASALAAATLMTVTAPTASANGSRHEHSITSCTWNGERHLEILLMPGDGRPPLTFDYQGTLDSNDRVWYWFEEIYSDGSIYQDDAYVSRFTGQNDSPSTYDYDASDAGQSWLFTFSAVSDDLDKAIFEGTPFGDPLCSLTYVMANEDGSDPRPAPPAPPVSAPTTSVACSPLPAPAGATVTCSVTGGDPGIDILWRASYNPVFAEAGVTLDADGNGTFSFVVPAAALGQEVMVELVEWTAPVSLGVTGSLVPTRIPAGEGRGVPAGVLAVLAGVALVVGVALRRDAVGRVG